MKATAERTHEEELRLVMEMQQGNGEAFTVLYEINVRRIHDFIYHKTFHRETARDLTQTVFLKAIEGIGRLNPNQGPFSAWLFAIARNTVVDHYRTRHPSMNIEDVWDLAVDQDVELDEQNRERYEALHHHMKRLTPEQRELLLLRIWQDLSFAEIAELRHCSVGSCKMAFHRLIRQLREEMPFLLLMLLILRP